MRSTSLMLTRGLAVGALLLAVAGCVNVQEHRARHQSVAYASYDAAKQTRLLAGTIAPGDEPEAVYIALGPPEARFPRGQGEGWLYVGHAAEQGAETVTFGSRAANDWGGDQQELVVMFQDGRVSDWQLQPLSAVGTGLTSETQRQRDAGQLVTWQGPWIGRDPYLER